MSLAVDPHRPLAQPQHAEHRLHRRRLAGAVGADDHGDLARVHRDGAAVQDVGAAVAAAHRLADEERFGGRDAGPGAHAEAVLFFRPVPRYASITASFCMMSDALPWASTRPSAMTMTGSQRRAMKSMSCSMRQKV